MKSKLWQAFVVVSISALAVPAFVQSQTAGGGATPGSSTSPGTTGSSRSMGGSGAPSGSTSHDSMTSPMESGTHSGSGSMGSSTTPGSSAPAGSMGMGASSDQAKSEADRTLNQNIHQALSADSVLAASAKNVHFNTDNGKVTLQGTVPTEKDKKDIEAKVEKMTGVKDVDNQLQIAPAATTSSAAGSTGSMGTTGGAGSSSAMGSRSGAESSGSGAMGSHSSAGR